MKKVICIDNKGYEISLTLNKEYDVIIEYPDHDSIRIIDDSDEDYIFSNKRFREKE